VALGVEMLIFIVKLVVFVAVLQVLRQIPKSSRIQWPRRYIVSRPHSFYHSLSQGGIVLSSVCLCVWLFCQQCSVFVSGNVGFPGSQGTIGSLGATGATGNRGANGFPGPTGPVGWTGAPGFPGGQGTYVVHMHERY